MSRQTCLPSGLCTALPSTVPPRLLSREQAAEYVNLSANKFTELVAQGVMPQPKCLGDHRIAWDIRELNAAIDELPHRKSIVTQNDTWSDIDAA